MGLITKLGDALQSWGDRLDLMQEMFRRNGALPQDPRDREAHGEMRAAMVACLNCAHGKECQTWLANVTVDSPPPDFCPNRSRIARLNGTSESRPA
ncbi:MAG: hypothetical protein HKN30_17060 [Sulfitobacter sp.]|nr:hypothetical protein [Sulfitobacter sp.]